MNKIILLSAFLLFICCKCLAQNATVKGLLKDEFNNPVAGAIISINQLSTKTIENGSFEIKEVPFGFQTLIIKSDGYIEYKEQVEVNKPLVDIITLTIRHTDQPKSNPENIPTISLSDDEAEGSSGEAATSSVLNASRDAFQQAVFYKFSAARFRVRGYDDENFSTMVNGIPSTDLTSGRTMYQTWSGLNDVLRSRESTIGLKATDFTFGGIGGNQNIDTRASKQRQQLQVSYALSNRTYDNRLMGTYGSGILKGGWAFALSASRRWAQEGYVEGTYTDDFSYYAAIEKIIGKHSISLTRLASENITGRSAATVQELYDLSGSNYYNPNWGYQNGEKRNAAVGRNSQPITILSHDWNISNSTELQTSFSYQYGKNSISTLDWYNAADPRPVYYRNFPSYSYYDNNDPQNAALITQLLSETDKYRQIQWDMLYDINRHANDTIYNANGIEGNTVYGKFAAYIVGERVTENQRFNFNSNLTTTINDHVSLTAGVNYQKQETDYYLKVNDLLGADFYVDYDNFADLSVSHDSTLLQNDLNRPNRILYVGDRYGYDYTADIKQYGGWLQGNFTYNSIDFHMAGNISQTTYQRIGNTRDGAFQDRSYGNSAETNFTNFGAKGGLTYKLNGRNYLFANGVYQTRAPWFEDAFISPRTRNDIVNNLEAQSISSVEGGYLLRAPKFKARVLFYYTQFSNDTRTIRFFNDDLRTFVNYTMTNIDKRHTGTELSVEANLGYGFTANAAASIGRYLYSSRPVIDVTADNVDTLFASNQTIYAKNYHVGGSPEAAYTAGIEYRAKRYWGFFVNVNCYDKMYLEFNPVRRTAAAVDLLSENDPLRAEVLEQKPFATQFTVDLSFNKSWRLNNKYKMFKRNTFIILNVGVDNIIDNQNIIIGGYEQLRFDFDKKRVDKFAPRYIYGFGRSFFISLTLRLN